MHPMSLRGSWRRRVQIQTPAAGARSVWAPNPESRSKKPGLHGIQLRLGLLAGHCGQIPEDKLAYVKVFC
ncbi:unnamed protein product [Rangifer tarandus platyrhynchus]|uniref:Uncharacterized protein n=1 Tax=Rangifer tarandus platyrhynchus TaxID=3082113 RepID=A0ABN8YES5_RANTA|nr:unnamed protein product [Rangifer tarandus platyrhynchus]